MIILQIVRTNYLNKKVVIRSCTNSPTIKEKTLLQIYIERLLEFVIETCIILCVIFCSLYKL